MIMIMAMATTALAAAAPGVSITQDASTGDTVMVTITTNNAGLSGNISTTGLSYNENSAPAGTSTDSFLFVTGERVIYYYTVTAAAGEEYSFSLSGMEGSDSSGNLSEVSGSAGASGTVPAAPAATPTPTPPAATPTPAPAADTALDDVPKTADATGSVWMVVVMVLAAAGFAGFAAYKKVVVK